MSDPTEQEIEACEEALLRAFQESSLYTIARNTLLALRTPPPPKERTMSDEPTPLNAASLQRRYAAGERDFHGADLLAADLRGANLHGADLHAADLRGANLRAAYLSGADLRGADLRDANLSGANIRGAQMPWIGTPAACPTLTQPPPPPVKRPHKRKA